jgi:uncharacterized protein (TIGR00290 family)
MSYSFGKDSALALYRMIQAGNEPICLITTVNVKNGRSWSHGISYDLIQKCSCALGLPIITAPCDAKNYELAFEDAIMKSVEIGAECCVFGDIDIEQHYDWNKARCKATNIECIVPLWGINRLEAVLETIELGFISLIKCVEKKYFGNGFLGKELNKEMIKKIQETGADVCGENGEYHTLAINGPIFLEPISIILGDIIDLGAYAAIGMK